MFYYQVALQCAHTHHTVIIQTSPNYTFTPNYINPRMFSSWLSIPHIYNTIFIIPVANKMVNWHNLLTPGTKMLRSILLVFTSWLQILPKLTYNKCSEGFYHLCLRSIMTDQSNLPTVSFVVKSVYGYTLVWCGLVLHFCSISSL